MTEAVLAGLGAISGGLGVMVLGLLRRNGNGRQNGAVNAATSKMLLEGMNRKMDDHHSNGEEMLLVLREMRTILKERLPRSNG